MLGVRLAVTLFIVVLFTKAVLLAQDLNCNNNFAADNNVSYTKFHPINITQVSHCIQKISNINLTKMDTAYIWKSIVKLLNSATNIPKETFVVLRWMIPRINISDYENLSFTDIDVIRNFGLDYNLTNDQLSAIADRVRKDFASKQPEDYTVYDLIALRNILCGFNRSEIERIHPSAYKEASEELGKLKCKTEVMAALAALAVHKQAYGPPDNWNDDVIKTIGEVAKYLPKKP